MSGYFSELVQRFGEGWNRFWFRPTDPYTLCVLRILVGLLSLYYVGSFTGDLLAWFGPNGLLTVESVGQLTNRFASRWSYLYWCDTPGSLGVAHAVGLLVLVCFTSGLATRVTSILAFIVVVSYVHRAPMITGPLEPVLTMLLLYLCLGPCGAYWSVDAWLRKRRGRAAVSPTVMANLSQRLLQVHVAAFYLLLGLNQLGGEPWWTGTAIWWLATRTESRLVDITFLHAPPQFYLLNLWTHLMVAFELLFAVLIWHRLARPLLIAGAFLCWLALIPVSGLTAFCLTMMVASLAFVRSESFQAATRYAAVAPG